MTEPWLVPAVSGSALALSLLEIRGALTLDDADRDSLLYVVSGEGAVTVDGARHEVGAGDAALVLAGEEAGLEGELSFLHATVGPEADRHAPLGPRETVVSLAAAGSESATGARSYRVLFGPENGSTRATLFAGFVPPGRAPWHFHLYDEIVWVPEGPARLHLEGGPEEDGAEELGPGSAVRLRPRQVHILENAGDRNMTVLGVFTPAGSPSAAYLAP